MKAHVDEEQDGLSKGCENSRYYSQSNWQNLPLERFIYHTKYKSDDDIKQQECVNKHSGDQ